jgi:Flp pilus assembly pilin Flp
MKLKALGTSLTEYALILGIAVVVFTIAAMGQMNQEVKGTYNSVISNMGGVTEDTPLKDAQSQNIQNLDQWEHWSQTGSMTKLADIYAGKLSNAKPGEWVRLNDHTQFQYRINPQTGEITFNVKDMQNTISGNTTAVEGGEILKAFSQTLEKWAQENQNLTPAEKSALNHLSQLGFQIAAQQITIDSMKKTQLSRSDLNATLNAYNQLPMLYAQFNRAAQKTSLSEQTLPLAALISSVTYYNYLSKNSLETNKNLLNQNNFFYNVTLMFTSFNLPPTSLDMVKPSENLNGQDTQQASEDLQHHGV